MNTVIAHNINKLKWIPSPDNFSWGMTEHENMWALGMFIGAASFGIFVALYLYTFRLLGIKVSVLVQDKREVKK